MYAWIFNINKNILPDVKTGDKVNIKELIDDQHFTDPPPRYSEASLVKKMEELGIGRPSTYASILEKLQNRGYVFKEGSRYFADDRGRIVTSLLENYFEQYVSMLSICLSTMQLIQSFYF